MKRFERDEELGRADEAGHRRLKRFVDALQRWLASDLSSRATIHAELLSIFASVTGDYFQNGLHNYYATGGVEDLLSAISTLLADENGALEIDDVRYFEDVRPKLLLDDARNRRIDALDAMPHRSTGDDDELERLRREDEAKGFVFEELFDRLERCIANWCIANPHLVDRDGQPVTIQGTTTLSMLFDEEAAAKH